jgi:guanylate kinase
MGEDWGVLPGRLIVVSGPSGSGKSTLVRRLLQRPGIRAQVSVSATTRPPRPGERRDRDYFFRTREEFEATCDQFLEWAEVHGHLYGTPARPVREALARGICVLLVIDVQGAMAVRQRVPNALLVFIQVPSLDLLEARLRARGTDDEATIARRLTNARAELAVADQYDVQLINDDLDYAVEELASLLIQNRCGG